MSKSTKTRLRATHGSEKTPLVIGDIEIPCYVLNDGTRVFSRNGMQKAIGYEGTSGDWLTRFVSSKNFEHAISKNLLAGLYDVIEFERLGAGGSVSATYGYEATKLIDLCDAILGLKKAGLLKATQLGYAEHAEAIVRSVAKVGIIALVDEATGYQYDRERDELQKILSLYISKELLPWQKRFPDEFYKEIFRLRGWDYTVKGIQDRPGVVGKWTNDLIYKQLPKGVLIELKKMQPKTATGKAAARLHQGLSLDIGNPHLEKQLVSVVTLMNISNTWAEFIGHFNKKFGQQVIPFPDSEMQAITPKPKVNSDSFDSTLGAMLKVPPPKKGGEK